MLDSLELAAHADLHHVQRRTQSARAFNGILLGQLGQDLAEIEPELRQALLRNLDIQFFVLHAEQFHLVDIGDAEQFMPHIVGENFELCIGKSVGLQGVHDAEDIAKLIVEKRS